MASTPSMVTYETRLHSFNEITKPKSKAKPPFPLSPTSYPNLTPANLATAGFFHDPGEDEESWDTCKCFLCGLKLGGWDETDDPFEEHVKRGSCAWAEFVCLPRLHRAKGTEFTWDTPESLPSSAESSAWRESTFMKAWPHKSKAGWLPTVKRLAQAGFVLNASTMSKDAVVCPLCEYSVEGWEATDDPWSIHMNKSPGCRFFTAQLATQAKSAGKASKPKAKRTQRKTEATTLAEALEESEVDHEDPDASTSQPKARRARAKSRGRNKAGKGTDLESQSAAGEDIIETEASDVEMEPPTVPAEKQTRGKGKGRGKAKAIDDVDNESQAETTVITALDSAAESPAEAVEAKKTVKKGGRKTITSKSRSKPAAAAPSDVPSASEAEMEYTDAIVLLPESEAEGSNTAAKSTSTRSRRQTQTQKAASSRSKSSRKTITSLDDMRDDDAQPSGTDVGGTTNDEEGPASKSQSTAKRPRGRTMKSGKTRGQAEETESEVPASEVEPVSAAPAPLAKSTSSRAKSTKAKKVAQPQVEETESESVAESVAPSEAESAPAPSTIKSSSSRAQTATTKAKASKTKSAPSRLQTDPASEAEQLEAPATVKKATRKPAKTKQDVVAPPSPPAQPRVLSQLERFANVPPSSPMHIAEETVDHETPRAKPPLVSAKPARPSPHAALPREQLDKSVAQGAIEARRVMHELVANIAGGEGEGHQSGKLTEEQKKMTLEELVRSEYRKQHEVMKSQGEGMIAMWEEKARQARRKIEML